MKIGILPDTNLGICSCLLLYANIWILGKHSSVGNFSYIGLLEKPRDDFVYVDKGHIMKDLAGPAKKCKHDSPC